MYSYNIFCNIHLQFSMILFFIPFFIPSIFLSNILDITMVISDVHEESNSATTQSEAVPVVIPTTVSHPHIAMATAMGSNVAIV